MREWLVSIRKEAKKSQQAVADAAGISQSYYAGIETGVRGKPVAVPVAQAIANVLGFSWTRFYEDTHGSTPTARKERECGSEQP
jgi:transcriptional regulator with XRE-family HTH domain